MYAEQDSTFERVHLLGDIQATLAESRGSGVRSGIGCLRSG